MATFSYFYATVIRRNVELCIIKCVSIDFLSQFYDSLARRIRLDDERLDLWDGAATFWGPDALTKLFKPGFRSKGIEWQDGALNF